LDSMIKTLSIVIPAYNEERTVALILDRVFDVTLIRNIGKEVIVVNDCSSDGTDQAVKDYIARNPERNIQYVVHERNRGKGAALHTGFKKATGEYVIVQDADLECDPEDWNEMLVPVIRGQADVVYGSRFIGNKPRRVLSYGHTLVNKYLTIFSNLFTNMNITDMETCYKLFDTKFIQGIPLKEERFGFEPEVTARISKVKGLRIYEVGIAYYARTREDGKKIGWKDGFRALYCIVRYNLFH
jgi:glycosyltransferase involved in cell wall biosynthesis